MSDKIIEMKKIRKSYGANLVLKDVDFSIDKGEIHALLGENGTGKTTLMNILDGLIDYEEGTIFYEGQEISKDGRGMEFLRSKISFVHQELALIPDLTVAENLFFAQELKNGLFLDNKKMNDKSKEILKQLDVSINPETVVRKLNASYQQVIEISKAIMRDSRVIIMDEPTSSLTENEIEQLFKVLNKLRDTGISIIFISHKLNEVLKICDSYTVLRDGVVVKSGEITEGLKESDLARYMVGKEVDSSHIYEVRQIGEILLETLDLSRDKEFSNVNINIRRGEVVGVTGLLGDGRSEVFETIFGSKASYQGRVLLNGKDIKCGSTSKSIERKISYVPRNRKVNSIIKDMSISDNLNMSSFKNESKFGIVDEEKIKSNNEEFKNKLNIKLEKFTNLITSLSGGNQQKVIIARALSTLPDIVILDNPTQGVDIGAKFEIYHQIIRLAKEGISFFILSNEAAEIMAVCDRTYVMFHGEVKAELQRSEFSEEKIMTIAMGGENDNG